MSAVRERIEHRSEPPECHGHTWRTSGGLLQDLGSFVFEQWRVVVERERPLEVGSVFLRGRNRTGLGRAREVSSGDRGGRAGEKVEIGRRAAAAIGAAARLLSVSGARSTRGEGVLRSFGWKRTRRNKVE